MLDDVTKQIKSQLKTLNDIRNVALYLFVLIVFAIAWSSVKTIQNNYVLQKQISTLRQQNDVTKLSNQNIVFQNQYYKSDHYLELAARQSLGLSAPGETIMLIPKDVAMKYIDPALVKSYVPVEGYRVDKRSKYVKNIEAWRDFLLGRKALTD